jgi:ribosomal protein L12E/L44/L45/RPP1/RPP2
MALEQLRAEIEMLVQQMDNQPEDIHELHARIRSKLNEIKAAQGGAATAEQAGDSPREEEDEREAGKAETHPHWSPPPVVRTVVGTFQPYDHLGQLAKVEAYHRGFTAASRKAFLGDGLAHNWTVQQNHFGDYTPIVDLMHALSYVYQAAKASTAEMEACWRLCIAWITLIWQGHIDELLKQIDQQLAADHDAAAKEELQASRRYLANNKQRMDYAEYRRRGLPITTAQMESTIKRVNRRIKGTEKFWGPTAEPMLQLCVDDLSETEPLTTYWRHRCLTRTGRRKSRTKR